MKKYIVVISHAENKVVHHVEVTGKSERQIDRIDSGLQINLDHRLYFTRIVDEIEFNDLTKGGERDKSKTDSSTYSG